MSALRTGKASAITVVSSSASKNVAQVEQQVVERGQEARPRVGGVEAGDRLAEQADAVLVLVLVGAPLDGQQVPLVLHVAPDEVVDGAQRVDLEAGQRVVARCSPSARFWKRREIAFIVWTSMPSSCQ